MFAAMSESQRKVGMLQGGMTFMRVARQFDVNACTPSMLHYRFNATGSVSGCQHTGRPRQSVCT